MIDFRSEMEEEREKIAYLVMDGLIKTDETGLIKNLIASAMNHKMPVEEVFPFIMELLTILKQFGGKKG